MVSLENPLAPYFEMEDQKECFIFTPTKEWDRLRKIVNPKSKKATYFVMDKKDDFVRLSMNIEETQPLTPFWKFKNEKWVIMGESRYRGNVFEQHALVEVCPECNQRIDCECNE